MNPFDGVDSKDRNALLRLFDVSEIAAWTSLISGALLLAWSAAAVHAKWASVRWGPLNSLLFLGGFVFGIIAMIYGWELRKLVGKAENLRYQLRPPWDVDSRSSRMDE